MALEVRWTLDAIHSRDSACQSLADYDVDAAIALDQSFSDRAAQLADFPYLGAVYEDNGKPTRYREIQVGDYRVFYEVKERRQRVSIVLVRHAARDEPTSDELK